MLTSIFAIPLCLAALASAASGEKVLEKRLVIGFPVYGEPATTDIAASAAKASDYSSITSPSGAFPTSIGITTDAEGRLSTYSVVNGSTINVITTATGAPPITITQVPSGQAGLVTVLNGETYTIATATGSGPTFATGALSSAKTLTPSWSVPFVSSAVLGLLGVVAGAYVAL